MQTTHSRMSAHGQPADVVAPGRRRRPRSPAHARGRPSQTAIRSRINTAVPCNDGGRPRMVPAPGGTTTALMHPGMTCHAFAWHVGAGAGGLGHGRRLHSRWPRPSHEQTVLMARHLRTEHGARRAWAGERAPSHLPCSTLARVPLRTSASGRLPTGFPIHAHESAPLPGRSRAGESPSRALFRRPAAKRCLRQGQEVRTPRMADEARKVRFGQSARTKRESRTRSTP